MSVQIEPLLTIADLEAMPEDENRYELFEGEIYVSRAPSLSHQRVLGNLFVIIREYLKQNPIGEILLTPGVIFNDINGAIPDAVFLSNLQRRTIITGERISGAPDLAIEIVSPGKENERRDRVVKRQVYGKHGVKEYWIADPQNKSLELYQLKGNTLELIATLMDEDEINSIVLLDLNCKVNRIFT